MLRMEIINRGRVLGCTVSTFVYYMYVYVLDVRVRACVHVVGAIIVERDHAVQTCKYVFPLSFVPKLACFYRPREAKINRRAFIKSRSRSRLVSMLVFRAPCCILRAPEP